MNNEFTYNVQHNISSELNDAHDKILLKEIINIIDEYNLIEYKHDSIEYEIDVNILKEALDLYFKNEHLFPRGKWNEEYVNTWGKLYRCSNCENISVNKTNYCSHCGRQMEV